MCDRNSFSCPAMSVKVSRVSVHYYSVVYVWNSRVVMNWKGEKEKMELVSDLVCVAVVAGGVVSFHESPKFRHSWPG